MIELLISPPVAFILVFTFLVILGRIFSKVSFLGGKKTDGQGKAYACGEDIKDHLSQPDYSQFFPYAFFFTIAHVATMIVTAVPMQTVRILVLAIIYITTIMVGLYILLRR